MPTSANTLRDLYIDYFEKKCDHVRVASSPIVPPDDPTMLFTGAGMVQFKPLYAGTVSPLPYTRATTCQKCLRAGGKASDLENVGKTARHHTFFEMLGNFSFGDYFKREALEWGWDFIWNVMKLPRERLWATIFEDDDEAEEILEKEIGIPANRIIRLDAKENFWGPAGDTGACGPCSEICFFMGSEAELEEANQQDKATIARRIVEEGDLFLEIWNMVFPQFDQQLDGSRPPLKNRGIDTGAGLERMTTALNFMETGGKVTMPYQTDLLAPIVRAVQQHVGEQSEDQKRFWVNAIADHVRALTFALSEGIVPSNEGRGYVLRRILRRASRFGYLLQKEEPFLYLIVETVVDVMGGVYPEIIKQARHTAEVIRLEEDRFLRTVAQGSKILDEKIVGMKKSGEKVLSGDDVFLLHATYGFPADLTAEILEDEGLEADLEGYEKAMEGHREEARKSWKGGASGEEAALFKDVKETTFTGYEKWEDNAELLALAVNGERVDSVGEGQEVVLAFDKTPFYAESGGQVGDTGEIIFPKGKMTVTDTQKLAEGIFLHKGKVEGSIQSGDKAQMLVDGERRMAIMRHHTATHLLQRAFKQILGDHVTQAGSWVGPEGMRFDFSHTQACTADELREAEARVNRWILEDHPLQIEEMPIEEARERGAIAPFGEKYGHRVRVVEVGQKVSIEFCGGTHLERTGQIGSFRILAESSVAAGIRRVEGVAGTAAYQSWAATRNVAETLSRSLAVKEEQLGERVAALQEEIKKLQKDVKKAKQSRSGLSAADLIHQGKKMGDITMICACLEEGDPEMMRTLADEIRQKAAPSVCVLGAKDGKKALLLCAVSQDATDKAHAGKIIKEVAALVGGGGGGRPDLAQAGGKNPEKLEEAMAAAPGIIEKMLG